jgi:hypothetical protein
LKRMKVHARASNGMQNAVETLASASEISKAAKW